MRLFDRFKEKFEIWVWNRTPHCDEVTRLASDSLEKPLSFRKKMLVRLHFVICPWCRRYFEQVHFLHGHAPELEDKREVVSGRVLEPDAKARIKSEIRKNLRPKD